MKNAMIIVKAHIYYQLDSVMWENIKSLQHFTNTSKVQLLLGNHVLHF